MGKINRILNLWHSFVKIYMKMGAVGGIGFVVVLAIPILIGVLLKNSSVVNAGVIFLIVGIALTLVVVIRNSRGQENNVDR